MVGYPDLTKRIARAKRLAKDGVEVFEVSRSGAQVWVVGEHRVVLWYHGGWRCDCEWGQAHSGEKFNPCAHVILAAASSDFGAERYTMPPPRLVKPVPEDPFEGLTG